MAHRTLNLSPTLKLPLEVITETIAILGIRGSGKTNTCVVMAEELLAAGQQVVAIDPTDAWWGLRSSRDGKSKGFSVAVFGGRHGDVPIAAGDGAAIADIVVDERIPAILSLRHLESQADQRRIVTDFARRLYHRKGEKDRATPMLLCIDEAHLFVPQRVGGAEAPMVGAIQKLVRQGQSSGIGVALIDQRAASVNKDVLTQLELLICHRTTSPQDRKALEAWIEQHDTAGHHADFMARLASLPQGTAWAWSPGWLDLFREVAVRQRDTFDSSATPKAGAAIVVPKVLAAVDFEAIRGRIAAQVEAKKAEDPKLLRARIAELEREAAKRGQGQALTPDQVKRLEQAAKELGRCVEIATQLTERTALATKDARIASQDILGVLAARAIATARPPLPVIPIASIPSVSRKRPEPEPSRDGLRSGYPRVASDGLPEGEARVLTVIAQHPDGVTRDQVTAITGYKRSTRDAYISRLDRRGGLIEIAGSIIVATDAAIPCLGETFRPLPTGPELVAHWLGELPEGEAKVFRVVSEGWPSTVTRDSITASTGFKRSTRDAYVSRLSRRRIVTVDRGGVRLAPVMGAT